MWAAHHATDRIEEVGCREWTATLDLDEVVRAALNRQPLTLPLTRTFTRSQNRLARTLKWAFVTLKEALQGTHMYCTVHTRQHSYTALGGTADYIYSTSFFTVQVHVKVTVAGDFWSEVIYSDKHTWTPDSPSKILYILVSNLPRYSIQTFSSFCLPGQ